jgi:hypothetical protein
MNLSTVEEQLLGNDGNSFTMVTHKKQQSVSTPAHAARTTSSTTSIAEHGVSIGSKTMSPVHTRSSTSNVGVLVTLSTFGAFHYRIFRIIQEIVQTTKAPNDPFIKQWKRITTQTFGKVTESSSFRTLSKAIGINDLDIHGYRWFIESCSGISNFVTITDGTVPNGFVYQLH